MFLMGCCFIRDAGWRNFFLLMFRFQKAGSSKFSAARLWLRTDRRLMPWRYWKLEAVAQAGAFWGLQGFIQRRLCVPKSWVLSRKLRTSSFFPESHPKEKLSPSSCFLAEFQLGYLGRVSEIKNYDECQVNGKLE